MIYQPPRASFRVFPTRFHSFDLPKWWCSWHGSPSSPHKMHNACRALQAGLQPWRCSSVIWDVALRRGAHSRRSVHACSDWIDPATWRILQFRVITMRLHVILLVWHKELISRRPGLKSDSCCSSGVWSNLSRSLSEGNLIHFRRPGRTYCSRLKGGRGASAHFLNTAEPTHLCLMSISGLESHQIAEPWLKEWAAERLTHLSHQHYFL